MIVTEEKKKKKTCKTTQKMVLATNSKSRQEPEVWEWTWDPFDEKRYLLGWDEKRKKKKVEMALQCMGILFKGYMGENNTG